MVRHVEQEQPSMSLDSILIASPEGTVAVLRSLPPDIHQDLECGVCREMMGRDSAQITNVPIPILFVKDVGFFWICGRFAEKLLIF